MTDRASSASPETFSAAYADDRLSFEHTSSQRVPFPSMDREIGAFEAELFYIVADLQDLSRDAPAHKRQALASISRLLRAVATGD